MVDVDVFAVLGDKKAKGLEGLPVMVSDGGGFPFMASRVASLCRKDESCNLR